MSTVYRVTIKGTEPWQKVSKSELKRDQVGATLAELWDQVGYDKSQISVEKIERVPLSMYDINAKPTQPVILVLDPWGSRPGQINKIQAIKVLRDLDPNKLCLKDAKDLVEGGGEIFCPWDLTAQVAMFIRDGLHEHQLYAEVCVRDEEPDPIADIPEEHRY